MFKKFLESLKRTENASLIEAIQEGYHFLFEHQDLLTFTVGNTKLGKDIQIFALPAGITCPFAKDCRASIKEGKVHDPKKYHPLLNVLIRDSKTEDDTVKVNPKSNVIDKFNRNDEVGITDKEIRRAEDIDNVEEKRIEEIDKNDSTIKFDSGVKTELPGIMNTKKSLEKDNLPYRCFAASEEHRPNTHKVRMRNYDLILQTLKEEGKQGVADLINGSINKNIKKIRVHESGDFFGEEYFEAWIDVANDNPDIMLYAYTKSVDMYLKYADKIPNNFVITPSIGSAQDRTIVEKNLPHAKVFVSYKQAIDAGYPIDFDDEIARTPPKERIKKFGTVNFGLLAHAAQSPGTISSKESRHNSVFLHGMKAHAEGFGGSKDDMFAFNDKHHYLNYLSSGDRKGELTFYGSLYDDWKAGWNYYASQNRGNKTTASQRPKIPYKETLTPKERAALRKKFHIKTEE